MVNKRKKNFYPLEGIVLVMFLFLGSFTFSGCDGSSTSSSTKDDDLSDDDAPVITDTNTTVPSLESIVLNKTTAVLKIGETLQLTASPNPANAIAVITWKSGHDAKLKVDANGLVTALAGTNEVSVTASHTSGQSASCKIVVVPNYKVYLKGNTDIIDGGQSGRRSILSGTGATPVAYYSSTEDAGDVPKPSLCWNTTGSPTKNDTTAAFNGTWYQLVSSINHSYKSITGLTANTNYYARLYVDTVNGTYYFEEIPFNSGYTFGTAHAGGKVFYNDGNGGGLVCSDVNIDSSIMRWSSITTNLGTTSTDVGTGLANTNLIVAQSTTSAAQSCKNYTTGGSGWFLPSGNELLMIYSSGLLPLTGVYWSSTESPDAGKALVISNDVPSLGALEKGTSSYVRAVKSF